MHFDDYWQVEMKLYMKAFEVLLSTHTVWYVEACLQNSLFRLQNFVSCRGYADISLKTISG